MSERNKTLIKWLFLITWIASSVLLLYKMIHTPIVIKLDLSILKEFVPNPMAGGGADNILPFNIFI